MKFSQLNTAFFALSSLFSMTAYSMDNQADLSWEDKDWDTELPTAAKTPEKQAETKKETPTGAKPDQQKLQKKGKSPSKQTDAGRLIERAQNYRHDESRSVESVRDLLRDALKIAQKTHNKYEESKAYQVLAKTYVATEPETAIKLFNEAIKSSPTYPDNYFSAGDVAGFVLNDFDNAVEYFSKGFKYCVNKQLHKQSIYFASLAKLHLKINKNCHEAKRLYQQAVNFCQRHDRQATARFERLLGNTYRKLNLHQSAYNYLSDALNHQDPEDFNETLIAYGAFGKALHAMGKIQEAKRIFAEGLAFSKQHTSSTDYRSLPAFYKNYALFLKSIAEKEQALKIFGEGITACKDAYAYKTSQLYKQHGIFLEEVGEFERALQAYKDGLEHAKKRKPTYCKELEHLIASVAAKLANNSIAHTVW